MMFLTIQSQALFGIIFLVVVGIALLISLALLLLSLKAQHQYDNNALPSLANYDEEEEDGLPMDYEEAEVPSAFIFLDDQLPEDADEGVVQADQLLRAARNAQGSHAVEKPKKKYRGLFSKKDDSI